MDQRHVVIVGGGAAGFFAAITSAQAGRRVTLIERGPQFLSKVRISGGGRCNVTHACFDARELSRYYPRGGGALLGRFQEFGPAETQAWFEARGVKLKTEADGRMFPVSDSSQTVIDCLLHAARTAGVELITNRAVESATRRAGGGFVVGLSQGEAFECEQLMLATGGCRAPVGGRLATALGHALEPPVPSLFAFHITAPWLCELAGSSLESVEVSLPGVSLRERGAVLVTHTGLSGPVILRLSAWGARGLYKLGYRFNLRVNWVPDRDAEALAAELQSLRRAQPARRVANTPLRPLSARLWEHLVLQAGIASQTRWAELSAAARHRLIQSLSRTELEVTGKSLNKEEFVTCGGVRLSEVDFRTMESRLCPSLYFGGELLDIDGLTGGFNFQSAWTTGWIAGRAMSSR